MYKLVAADDEVTALKFIDYCIKKNKLPVTLVGTAMDGKEAISLVEDLHPDIVLLDIKMPKFSGVEVGKYIAEKYPRTKVIMLTAYNQFDFAQQAIRFNAYDYLLKPVKPEQLIEVIEKAIKEINQQRLAEEQNQRQKAVLEQLKSPLLKKSITSLVTTGKLEQAVLYDNQLLNGPLQCQNIGHMVVWQKDGSKSCNHILVEKLINKLNDSMQHGFFVYLEASNDIVFYSEKSDIEFRKLKDALHNVLQEDYCHALTLANIKYFSGVPEAYSHSRINSRNKAFWQKEGIFFVDSSLDKESHNFESTRELENKLIKSYFSSNDNTLKKNTQEIIASIINSVMHLKPCPDQTKSYFEELVVLIAWSFLEKKVAVDEIEKLKNETTASIRATINCAEIKDIIYNYDESLLKILLKPESRNVEQVVSWIQNYLQVNYQQNITLEHLADKVYLSPCYVSRAFRQVTGLNFMQYLTKIRIERAMQLLKAGQYTVSEVAKAVGYKDSSYFSQIFKKKTGLTPSELMNKQAK